MPVTVHPAPANGTSAVLRREVVGAGGATTISFAAIEQTFENLRLTVVGRSSAAALEQDDVKVRFNGDAEAHHTLQLLTVTDTASTVTESVDKDGLIVGWISASTSPANNPGVVVADVLSYARSTFHKPVLSSTGAKRNATRNQIGQMMSIWPNTAAVSTMSVSLATGTFVEGTVVQLEGIGGTPLA